MVWYYRCGRSSHGLCRRLRSSSPLRPLTTSSLLELLTGSTGSSRQHVQTSAVFTTMIRTWNGSRCANGIQTPMSRVWIRDTPRSHATVLTRIIALVFESVCWIIAVFAAQTCSIEKVSRQVPSVSLHHRFFQRIALHTNVSMRRSTPGSLFMGCSRRSTATLILKGRLHNHDVSICSSFKVCMSTVGSLGRNSIIRHVS